MRDLPDSSTSLDRPAHTTRLRRAGALRLAVAVAVAALTAGTGVALAQVPANQSGRALDANPLVGSGGSNTGVQSFGRYSGLQGQGIFGGPAGSFGNNVISGNITGGFEFRGVSAFRDTSAFRGPNAGSLIDNFARDSSGVSANGTVVNNAGSVRPFFGNSVTVAPPRGLMETQATGNFVAASTNDRLRDFDRNLMVQDELARRFGTTNRDAFDFGGASTRVDARVPVNVSGRGNQVPTLLGNNLAERYGASSLADVSGRAISPYTRLGRDGRLSTLTSDRLDALTAELQRPGANAAQPSVIADPAGARDARDAAEQVDPRETTRDRVRAINEAGRAIDAENDPASFLLDPGRQSAQYRQLVDRLERFEKDPLADALRPSGLKRQTERGSDDLMTLPGMDFFGQPDLNPADQPAERPVDVPRTPRRPANDGDVERSLIPDASPASPDAQQNGSASAAPVDPPVAIQSFSAGVSSPTLRDLLTEAETLMKQGQYVSALARYDAAERIVPNQPLMGLARANALLGGGYYARANRDLRNAFRATPELLMAQVDADGLLGKDRVDELAEDLRQRAESNERAHEPAFLLAYLSYGRGDFNRAAALLDVAQQRSNDPFYALVKKSWALDERIETEPAATAPATQPPTVPATQPVTPPTSMPGPDADVDEQALDDMILGK